MPIFHYRAVDRSGNLVTGTLDRTDAREVARHLHQQGSTPLRVDQNRSTTVADILNIEITPRDALNTSGRIAFTRSLATLMDAGLALDRALEIVRDLGADRAVRKIAAALLEDVREGASFSDALDAHPAAFSPLFRGIVRAGESGADLDLTLTRLAEMLEEHARRSGELRSAMIYPAFLIVTAMGSVGVLLGYVVPTFEPLLADAGVEPPAITQFVIAVGEFVSRNWQVLVLGALSAGIAIRVALAFEKVRLQWHRALLSVPLLGGMLLKFEAARFARVLGTLLGNGVPLPAALRLTTPALGNLALAAKISQIVPEVEAGRGLARPLREHVLLPPLALQLIQVGHESGKLTAMLMKIAEIFEDDSKRAFDQAISLLTPLLTLVMGGLIAVIISSILFALFSINELAF